MLIFIYHFVVIHSNFRVCDYIKYGWDVYLIDPDGGAYVQHKLQTIAAKKEMFRCHSVSINSKTK